MNLRQIIKKAPRDPGIYVFKGKGRRVLYVGKAANLRARLGSYLRPGWKETMLKEAQSISWETLGSDIEAIIRESLLIKIHRPQYNIIFRDDKNYFFVAFTGDKFPRIFLTHQPNKDVGRPLGRPTSKYIGPFTDGAAIKNALRLLRRAFPYCTCSNKRPHSRRCVNAEIGRCPGYCCLDKPPTLKERRRYLSNIEAIKKILNGKTGSLSRELEKKMERFSRARRYEEALIARNQLKSLKSIFEHQPFLKKEISEERLRALSSLKDLLHLKDIPHRIEGYDISHHQGSASVASMVVFENGVPRKSGYRKFIIRTVSGINDPAMLGEALARRLTHREWQSPDLILVDGGKAQLNTVLHVLKTSDVQWTSDVPRPSLAAIAKREEKLYLQGHREPFKLSKLPSPLLYLLTHIRDEAHRFAVAFHRKRRRDNFLPNSAI